MKKKRTDEELMWEKLSSEYLIQRPWLTARCDKVKLPNGIVQDEYYVLEYPSWVNVVAETTEGMLVLERQYRHGLEIISTEICAGCVEESETPLEAAKRELQEETGYTGGEWEELMVVSPNPSIMNNLCHCFLARGVRLTSPTHFDRTEDIETFLRTKQETYEMLMQGEFKQAMMMAPLWKYFTVYCKEMIR